MEKLVHQIIAYISTIPRPKNWVLKLLSFLFALFLWYFVVGEDKVDMNVSVPVEIVNLPRDLVISNQFKKQLEVTVSGQRSLIRGLSSQQTNRTIDLSNATPGKVDVPNEPDSIDFPWGISVLRVQPSHLTLLLDRLLKKELLIKPVINGSLPEGFQLVSLSLDPAAITVTGPQNILGAEEFLNTHKIDISNLKNSVAKQVTLDLKPVLADLLGEPVVTVNISIAEKMKEMLITDIPIQILGDSEGKYQIIPATVNIEAQLPYSMIKESKNLKNIFRATANPSDLSQSNKALSLTLAVSEEAGKYKDRIKILSGNPETVLLEINEISKLKIKK